MKSIHIDFPDVDHNYADTGLAGPALLAMTEAGYIDGASGRKLAFALFLRDVSLGADLHEFFDADHHLGAILAAIQQSY